MAKGARAPNPYATALKTWELTFEARRQLGVSRRLLQRTTTGNGNMAAKTGKISPSLKGNI